MRAYQGWGRCAARGEAVVPTLMGYELRGSLTGSCGLTALSRALSLVNGGWVIGAAWNRCLSCSRRVFRRWLDCRQRVANATARRNGPQGAWEIGIVRVGGVLEHVRIRRKRVVRMTRAHRHRKLRSWRGEEAGRGRVAAGVGPRRLMLGAQREVTSRRQDRYGCRIGSVGRGGAVCAHAPTADGGPVRAVEIVPGPCADCTWGAGACGACVVDVCCGTRSRRDAGRAGSRGERRRCGVVRRAKAGQRRFSFCW